MTTQEAIKILDNLKPGDYSNPYEKGEAIVMAISALQAQESSQNVPNGDFILRKAAIDELEEHRALFCDHTPETFRCLSYGDKCRVDEIDMAIATLVNLPSAQPETGHWISARDEDGWHTWLICSKCNAKETNMKAKYCLMCGRKMV